jgi:hypothetical protein
MARLDDLAHAARRHQVAGLRQLLRHAVGCAAERVERKPLQPRKERAVDEPRPFGLDDLEVTRARGGAPDPDLQVAHRLLVVCLGRGAPRRILPGSLIEPPPYLVLGFASLGRLLGRGLCARGRGGARACEPAPAEERGQRQKR